MTTQKAAPLKAGAAVQDLIRGAASPSRSERRLAHKLDGEIFRGDGAKERYNQRRSELRAQGFKVSRSRVNLGGEVGEVVIVLKADPGDAAAITEGAVAVFRGADAMEKAREKRAEIRSTYEGGKWGQDRAQILQANDDGELVAAVHHSGVAS